MTRTESDSQTGAATYPPQLVDELFDAADHYTAAPGGAARQRLLDAIAILSEYRRPERWRSGDVVVIGTDDNRCTALRINNTWVCDCNAHDVGEHTDDTLAEAADRGVVALLVRDGQVAE
jgi:hypothetical protein